MKISFTTLCFISVLTIFAADEPKNLVTNGGFELTAPDNKLIPLGWEQPDGLGVKWIEEKSPHKKYIRMDTSVSEIDMSAQWKKMGLTRWSFPEPKKNPIAATYGLSLYSVAMPVEKGKTYRVIFDFKGKKAGGEGGAKVWVRGYGMFRGEKRRRWETIVNCRVKQDQEWTHFSQEFHPTKFRKEVTEIKIMLYAYWPPGSYCFDNLRIEEVPPKKSPTAE